MKTKKSIDWYDTQNRINELGNDSVPSKFDLPQHRSYP